jgi:hypothetical protein
METGVAVAVIGEIGGGEGEGDSDDCDGNWCVGEEKEDK